MKLTKKQFRKIEHLMPIARNPPEISNYQFMCALLYIIENGCKWRALPKKFGNWHTIYMRFSRWSKNGTIQEILEAMQEMNIIDIRTKSLSLDSTSIKVHPDAAGARKSSGEQSIGRSKGGWQRSYTFVALLQGMPLFFIFHPVITMMHQKVGNWLKQYAQMIIITFWWTEPMKMIRLVLWRKNKDSMLSFLLKRIVKDLGIMIKNFTNNEMK